jgi:phospholipid/cholesterol/gamma-HCH transport system substrate-binding protein
MSAQKSGSVSEREPKVSRWRHFRNSLSRQARGRGKDTIAIVVLALVGIVMTLWIFTQQKASLPAWVPFVGEEFAHITGEFTTAQAVTPGQGQAVDVAGIQIGKVTSVDLKDGHAVVGMDIEPKYLELIHPDATLLLRPKTNLNDMVVEIDPGEGKGHIEDGANFPLSRTEPNVNLDAFLATLDADTRQYIQLLVAGGAQGIGGRGHQLSGAFRRLQPFSHYIADLTKVVAQRRAAIARSIHDFSLLTTELARHDSELERFVSGSKAALGNFANQQQSLQQALVEFPATLTAAEAGLASSNRFSTVARPALLGLIPQAQALGPALQANERLFKQTTAPIRDQIRPFTRQIRPVLTHLEEGSADLDKSVRGFGNSLGNFNYFLNELAYKPKDSRQSYLFYLPWLNHDFNATYNLADPAGPIQRSLVQISCNGTWLAYGVIKGIPGVTPRKQYLETLLQGANVPRQGELPPVAADPQEPERFCGPGSE